MVSELERGLVEAQTVMALSRAAQAVGATLRVDLVVPGGDIRGLLDADHALIQSAWTGMLRRFGWSVDAEVTFNHFGERGSVDLLAWHEATRTMLVVEIKTVIVDVQDLLAGVDRKVRIAGRLAAETGRRSARVVPLLLVAEGTTARRRIRDHAPLFDRFELRGRNAVSWLRNPAAAPPSGILCLTKSPSAPPGDRRRAGRARVRVRETL